MFVSTCVAKWKAPYTTQLWLLVRSICV